MDLSSLEGPPITDSRFSSPAPSTFSVPHIRLEDTTSPVSPMEPNTYDLPPRPASTSAIPPHRKYPNTNTPGFYQALHPNNTERSFRTPPNQSLNPGILQRVSHFTTSTNTFLPTPRSCRPYSNSVSTPHQLVWLESEQIWLLTARSVNPTPEPYQRPQSSRSNPGSSSLGISHSRSMGLCSSMDYALDIDPDDLPPPYEAHVFDRPLGPIAPPVPRVQPQQAPAPCRSRWDAIGRRVS